MKKSILLLSFLGTGFSGYLSGVKFFRQTCAFNETCPYFWGYPACYFGFGMFLTLLVLALLYFLKNTRQNFFLKGIAAISFLGTVFAGYFTLLELPVLFSQGFGAYFFGLPTCALGLVFFLLILVFGLMSKGNLPEK